ncbi:MAG: lytic transglycosylase domain-containing protein [Myxococcota bacterium]
MKIAALSVFFALGVLAQSVSLSDEPAEIEQSAPSTDVALSSDFDIFPRPQILLPNIAFWRRVYGELTSNQIIFSDAEDLSLVYRVMTVPGSGRTREQAIKQAKAEIATVLKELDACEPDSRDGLPGLAGEIYEALKDNPREDKFRRWDFIRAQTGLKNQFREGYMRSGAHENEIRSRLRRAGLPEELIGIVFVESLFHPKSKSSVGATGIWQFMRRTAFEYMRVNRLVDERLDPIVSTEAAIRYIQSAKSSLVEWPLIITSYNYGRGGMAKAAQMVGSRDFEVILKNYQNPRFGFAARNYYAEFLAAVDVYRQAKQIFPDAQPITHWAYDVIQLPKAVSVTDLLSTRAVEAVWLKTYNPALTSFAHRGREILPKGFTLRVPSADRKRLEARLAFLPERKTRKSRKRARLSTCHFTQLPTATIMTD